MGRPLPAIAIAQADAVLHNIPYEVYDAFRAHYHNAKRRKLPFQFTLPEWWAWWQTDNRWEKRGLKGNGYVMCRREDKGGYSPENVYCATTRQNIGDSDKLPASVKIKAHWAAKTPEQRAAWHLAVRGDGHPASRAVLTPLGRFGSGSLAAEAHGITRQYATLLARTCSKGWSYETAPNCSVPADLDDDANEIKPTSWM